MQGKRTYLALTPIVAVLLARLLGRYLPADMATQLAQALSADVVAEVAAGSALLAAYFRSRVGKPALPGRKRKA